jgi:hypothetical protein
LQAAKHGHLHKIHEHCEGDRRGERAPTTTAGRAFIANPPIDKMDAISTSPTDEMATHVFGREDHRRRRSRFV